MWATAPHADGDSGIDNAWGQIVRLAGTVGAKTPTMLFRVSSYSGERDDDQVEVSLYAGLGLAPRGDAGDGGGDPLWDGRDRWNIRREMLSASASVDEPLYRDDHAYVADGTLVAHFQKALWSPGDARSPNELVPVSGVVMAGLLTRVGDLWMLKDAVVGMRIWINDLLTSLAQVPTNPDGGIICQNKTNYDAYRRYYCTFVDIASDPGLPSSAPCDALSTVALFQAPQALPGEVLPPALPLALDCASGIDPATDTCEPPED